MHFLVGWFQHATAVPLSESCDKPYWTSFKLLVTSIRISLSRFMRLISILFLESCG